MFSLNNYQSSKNVDFQTEHISLFPTVVEVLPENELNLLATELSHDTPWADRQDAARKIGQTREPEAMIILQTALVNDPFWMVRCVIIQALESFGDPRVIPTLQEVAANDGFAAVRTAAEMAVNRLSR